MSDELEAIEVDETNIVDMQAQLEAQNNELIQRLDLLGQRPTPLMFMHAEIQTLVDFMFDDADARVAFEFACHVRVNTMLKQAVAAHAQTLLVPDGTPAG